MNKRKKSMILKWIVMVEVATLLIMINIVLVSYVDKACRLETESASVENTRVETQQKVSNSSIKTEKSLVPAAKKVGASMEDTIKVLVNKDHKIEKDYTVDLVTYKKTDKKIAKSMEQPLKDMIEAGENEGLSFTIVSAYRSNQYQKNLYARHVQKNIRQGMTKEEAAIEAAKSVQPSGYSEHATGLAVDIVSKKNSKLNASQEKTEEFKWLKKNCYKYGFILRYPEGKTDITGIIYEPWHFRYVGKKAAKFITKNSLTFEEFSELIETE